MAFAHHHDPVAEGHRLDLIVGDVDHCDFQILMQPRDLATHRHAHLRVEVGEGLVEQESLGLPDDRAPQCHALSLTAGKIARLAIEIVFETKRRRRCLHPFLDLGAWHVLELEREPEIFAHRHVRVESVVLEYHGDVARLGRNVVDDAITDSYGAGADGFEAGDHA